MVRLVYCSMAKARTTKVVEWSGPYTFNVGSDSRATDGCGASINNSDAFSKFSDGEAVKLRVENGGGSVEYSHTVKESHSGSNYSTIPMKYRKELGLDPGDTPKFYVQKLEGSEPRPNALVTRSGSVYHKITPSGETVCDVVGSDCYRNRSSVPTYESLVGDDYELCSACESKLKTENMTLEELEQKVIDEYGLNPDMGILSKENLFGLLKHSGGSG